MAEKDPNLPDPPLDLYQFGVENAPKQYRQSIKEEGIVGYDETFGDSKYDEGLFPKLALSSEDPELDLGAFIKENRAQKQPWAMKAGALIPRVGVKILGEVAKMPGVLGGAIAAGFQEEGEGWEMAVNNAWIRKINEWQEDINNEILPVYVKKAVEEGNLWKNITSVDFWATEGADGIGFIASMLVPGAAIKGLGIGAKVMRGVGGAVKGIGKGAGKLDDAANFLKNIKPSTIDNLSQATANTLFEAAAEAKGAGDAYETEMKEKLENGEITDTQFKNGKAEAMRNVFVANTAILLGPNIIMAKIIYGKNAAKMGARGAAKEAVKKTFRSRAGHLTGDVLQATGREGFFEEGLQSTVEEMSVSRAAAGKEIKSIQDLGEAFSELPEAYLEMLQTVDGQKAIFLGGFLGGGMQAYQGKRERAYENKTDRAILQEIEKVDSFYGLFKADVYNMETGKVSASKMVDKLASIEGMEHISNLYDEAAKSGNQVQTDAIRAWAIGELAKGFVDKGDKGIATLQEYLKESSPIADIAGLENVDKKEVSEGILKRAEKLQGDFALFQEFGPSFMKMENENATKEDIDSFYNILSYDYVGKKNMFYHYQEALAKNKTKLSEVLKSFGLNEDLSKEKNELKTQDVLGKNPIINKIRNDISLYQKRIDELEKTFNEYWSPETHQKAFDLRVSEHQNMKDQMEEEKQNQVEEVVGQIKSATLENIDEIVIPKGPAAKQLNKQLKERRKELEKGIEDVQEEVADEEESDFIFDEEDKALNKEKTSDLGNWLANNTNVDEPVSITAEESPKYGRSGENDDLYIAEINDKEVIIVNLNKDGTEKYSIPRNVKADKAPSHEPIQDYNTEGSDLHDDYTPIANANEGTTSDKVAGTGSKVISWDRVNNKLFDYISEQFRAFELTPKDKKGDTVGFALNLAPGDNAEINKALKAFQEEDFSDMELLINYLPISAVFAPGVEAPIETKYKTKDGNSIKFNGSSRSLRVDILNALQAGATFEDLSTTIEGQYKGMLVVDEKKENGETRKNSILDLHFLAGLSKKDKLEKIRKSIGVVRGTGDIQFIHDGSIHALNKPKAKGELFLMIPMANGEMFPLNLNITHLQEEHADLLFDLYNLRIKDPSISKDAVLNELEDKEFVKKFKAAFKKELTLIGRGKDTTVRDVTDFLIWDGTKSANKKIGFGGTGNKGEREFVYGNLQGNGNIVGPGGELSREAFMDWLTTTKRYNITTQAHANQLSKANIKNNTKYLEYLLDNKILNTNAVVGENTPTFQGYAAIYLNTNGLVNKNVKDSYLEAVEKTQAEMDKEKKDRQVEFDRLRKKGLGMVEAAEEAARIVSERNNPAKPAPIKKVLEKDPNQAALDKMKAKNDKVSSESLENNKENIRNSHKNFVSSHDIKNTEEANKAEEMKEETKSADTLSEELVKERLPLLMTYVIKNNLMKIGVKTIQLSKKSTQEQYNFLADLVEKNDETVENAILKCK